MQAQQQPRGASVDAGGEFDADDYLPRDRDTHPASVAQRQTPAASVPSGATPDAAEAFDEGDGGWDDADVPAGSAAAAEEEAALPPSAQEYLATLKSAIQAPARAGSAPGTFERLWDGMDGATRSCLVRSPSLWRLLASALPAFEGLFDVRSVVLAQLALEREGRAESSTSGFTTALAEALIARSAAARNDKQLERAVSTSTTLALLALDAPVTANAPWVLQLALRTVDAVRRAQSHPNAHYEAYSLLTVFIKLFYVCTDSPLCALIASTFLGHSDGGVPLMYSVSKQLLAQDLKGIPKIIAEKSLLALSKLHAELPTFVPEQLSASKLGKLLVLIARDASWVQSRDISLVFLARLLFVQRTLAVEFLDQPEVVATLRALLSSAVKSLPLRISAAAFVSLCPPATFYQVAHEFDAVLASVPSMSFRSMKVRGGDCRQALRDKFGVEL